MMPALLTRTSRRPKRCSTWSTIARTWSSRATSARTADHLRIAHEVEEAALLVGAVELFLPDLEHVLLAADAGAHLRHRAEAEERPVVVAPRRRQLDQLAVLRLVAVRQVGVHEIGVIGEAVLLEQIHRVLRRIGRRQARALGSEVQHLLEDVERLQ